MYSSPTEQWRHLKGDKYAAYTSAINEEDPLELSITVNTDAAIEFDNTTPIDFAFPLANVFTLLDSTKREAPQKRTPFYIDEIKLSMVKGMQLHPYVVTFYKKNFEKVTGELQPYNTPAKTFVQGMWGDARVDFLSSFCISGDMNKPIFANMANESSANDVELLANIRETHMWWGKTEYNPDAADIDDDTPASTISDVYVAGMDDVDERTRGSVVAKPGMAGQFSSEWYTIPVEITESTAAGRTQGAHPVAWVAIDEEAMYNTNKADNNKPYKPFRVRPDGVREVTSENIEGLLASAKRIIIHRDVYKSIVERIEKAQSIIKVPGAGAEIVIRCVPVVGLNDAATTASKAPSKKDQKDLPAWAPAQLQLEFTLSIIRFSGKIQLVAYKQLSKQT